jgi:hypothetical protein
VTGVLVGFVLGTGEQKEGKFAKELNLSRPRTLDDFQSLNDFDD